MSLLIWGAVAIAIFKAAELPIKALPVYGYGSMLFLGFLASSSLAAWRLRREKVDGEIAWDVAMWIFIFGIVGARLFYIMEYWATSFAVDPETGNARTAWEIAIALVNLPDGGLVLYGGLIFAPLAYYVYCRVRGHQRPTALCPISPLRRSSSESCSAGWVACSTVAASAACAHRCRGPSLFRPKACRSKHWSYEDCSTVPPIAVCRCIPHSFTMPSADCSWRF